MKEIYNLSKLNWNNTPNQNGRIYPKEAFEKCLADYKRTIWKELRKAERKEKLEKLENVQIRNDGMV